MTIEPAMRAALDEARAARDADEVPVGCVLLHNGDIIARGHNRRIRDRDPTAHAEMVALRQAAAARGDWRLEDCTLVVTLEPCAMCAGALVAARVGELVRLRRPQGGRRTHALPHLRRLAAQSSPAHHRRRHGGRMRGDPQRLLPRPPSVTRFAFLDAARPLA